MWYVLFSLLRLRFSLIGQISKNSTQLAFACCVLYLFTQVYGRFFMITAIVVADLGSLLVGSIEEGHDLSAVTAVGGAEVGGIQTGGDAVLHGPEDGLIEEIGILHIHEGILVAGGVRGTGGTPQEGDDGGTVTGVKGAEGGGRSTAGDVLLHRPQHGLVEEVRTLYILEGIPGGGGGRASGSPVEEGHHLGAEAGILGAEEQIRHAAGDAVLHGPDDGGVVIAVRGNIVEGCLRVHLVHMELGGIHIVLVIVVSPDAVSLPSCSIIS